MILNLLVLLAGSKFIYLISHTVILNLLLLLLFYLQRKSGAFGEVRLVRMKERFNKEIYGISISFLSKIKVINYYNYYLFPILAMKSMLKDAMISKNQVGHIRAERDILTESENPWIVTLYYSFQV